MICSLTKHPIPRVPINCSHEDKPNKWNDIPCCAECFAEARAAYDANWAAHYAETEACPDCAIARAQELDRLQRTETIDPNEVYGQHIPLCCRQHMPTGDKATDLFWNTKNIAAGRSIFFNGRNLHQVECSCPAYDLFSPGRFLNRLIRLYGGDPVFNRG